MGIAKLLYSRQRKTFNPLSADVEYTPHEGDVTWGDVTCSHCGASYRQNRVFERGENLLQNDVLYFVIRISQLSEKAFES